MGHSCQQYFSFLCTLLGEKPKLPVYTLTNPQEKSEQAIMGHTNQWHVERQPEEPPCSWGLSTTVLNANYRPSAEKWRDPMGLEERSSLPHPLLNFLLSLFRQRHSSRMRYQRKKQILNFSIFKWRRSGTASHKADFQSWHKIWMVHFYCYCFIYWLPWCLLAWAAFSILAWRIFKLKLQTYNYYFSWMLLREITMWLAICYYLKVE